MYGFSLLLKNFFNVVPHKQFVISFVDVNYHQPLLDLKGVRRVIVSLKKDLVESEGTNGLLPVSLETVLTDRT